MIEFTPNELAALTTCVKVYEDENGHVAAGFLAAIYGPAKSTAVQSTIRDAKSALEKITTREHAKNEARRRRRPEQ